MKIRKIFDGIMDYSVSEEERNSNVYKLNQILRTNNMHLSYAFDYTDSDHEETAGEILASVKRLLEGKLEDISDQRL